eukprot:974165-Pyramimonas_sp.AAC.1
MARAATGARLWRRALGHFRVASPRGEGIFAEEEGTPRTFLEKLGSFNMREVVLVATGMPRQQRTFAPAAAARAPGDGALEARGDQ